MGTDIIVWLLWIGGVFGVPNEYGLLRSFFWPYYLGKSLGRKAILEMSKPKTKSKA